MMPMALKTMRASRRKKSKSWRKAQAMLVGVRAATTAVEFRVSSPPPTSRSGIPVVSDMIAASSCFFLFLLL